MILRFLAVFLVAAAAATAGEWTHLRVMKPASLERGQSRVSLPDIAQSDEGLQVRLSITHPALVRMDWTEAQLRGAELSAFVSGGLKLVTVSSAAFASRMRISERGTAISFETVTLTFPADSHAWNLAAAGHLNLRLRDGENLPFDVNAAESFVPFRWADLQGTIPLDIEIRSSTAGAAMFPMHLRSLRVVDEELELQLGFENAHRLPVQWKGKFSGSHLRLCTRDGATLTPTKVSESLQNTILPVGKSIASGACNEGSVRLSLLAPEEAEQFTLLLPSYRPMTLVFDGAAKTWKPLQDHASNHAWTAADAALEKERRFTALRAFLQNTVKLAVSGDAAAFTERFGHSLRADADSFARGLKKTTVSDLRWDLDPFCEVVLDGDATQELGMVMNYRIPGLGESNEFALDAKIKLRRTGRDSWQITQITYPMHTPFWQCGYTSSERTEHFTVFHLPDREGQKQAESTGRDLEKAYAALSAEGLRLRDRYAAFAITRADDFRALTSRNPGTYSGVASMRQVFRDGHLRNINLAIYINDPRFAFLERLMRRQGHLQTVQHELTHLAFANASMPWTPAWLEEGLAMHFAGQLGREDVMDLRQLLTPGLTLKNMSIVPYLGYGTEPHPVAIQAQYLMSAATVKWLITKFGVESVIAFHRSFAIDYEEEWKRKPVKDQERMAQRRLEVTRVAVKKHFGLSLEALEAAVKTSL